MFNSNHPVTPDGVTCDDLEKLFKERFPSITDTDLAALIAQFIEEIPFTAAMTSDGVLVSLHEHRMPNPVARIVEDLKSIAGDAYPFYKRRLAS